MNKSNCFFMLLILSYLPMVDASPLWRTRIAQVRSPKDVMTLSMDLWTCIDIVRSIHTSCEQKQTVLRQMEVGIDNLAQGISFLLMQEVGWLPHMRENDHLLSLILAIEESLSQVFEQCGGSNFAHCVEQLNWVERVLKLPTEIQAQ